jgi:hypothetical protein
MAKIRMKTEDLVRVSETASGKLAGAAVLQVEENDFRMSFTIIAPQERVGQRIYFTRADVEQLLANEILTLEVRQ